MAQQVSEYIPTNQVTDFPKTENNEISSQTTAQVTMALSALDSRYKENVAAYAQELYSCTHKIETARITLDLIYKEKEPYSKGLLSLEKEIDHEIRMLEHFTEQWIQKTVVVTELENELKQLDQTKESDMMFQHRRNELKKLQEETEDLELTLLKNELEKQNLLLKLEPINHKIYAVQKNIRELESQKRYIESSHLHRITQVMPAQQQKLPYEDISDR
jgi:chromosome segregation ATPase